MPPLTVGELKKKLDNVPDDYVIRIFNYESNFFDVEECYRIHDFGVYVLTLGREVK